MTGDGGNGGQVPADIDTTVPHSARIWNYWLGGRDNYPADRQAGEQTKAVLPEIVDIALASRRFLVRAVEYLAGAGIRQFLDMGTGLPTASNTHQVAPESRVVYVDNDRCKSGCAHAWAAGQQQTKPSGDRPAARVAQLDPSAPEPKYLRVP